MRTLLAVPPFVGWTAVAAAVIGAIATFTVGLMNYRSQRQARASADAQAHWQREHQARQIELLRSGQTTDRFTRAIEQLVAW
jgi:type II secretory pathway pseudopilin PulG